MTLESIKYCTHEKPAISVIILTTYVVRWTAFLLLLSLTVHVWKDRLDWSLKDIEKVKEENKKRRHLPFNWTFAIDLLSVLDYK